MVKNSGFSLRTLTLSSVSWYATVPVGWALLVLAVGHVATAPSVEQPAAFVMTASLLVLLELLPLVAGRGHDPQGVVMSTAFLCAMLFVWGVWPAMLMVGIASLAADLRARKQWWKVLFNPAQYAVSVGAAYWPSGPCTGRSGWTTRCRGSMSTRCCGSRSRGSSTTSSTGSSSAASSATPDPSRPC